MKDEDDAFYLTAMSQMEATNYSQTVATSNPRAPPLPPSSVVYTPRVPLSSSSSFYPSSSTQGKSLPPTFSLPQSATFTGLQQSVNTSIESNRPFYGYFRSPQDTEQEELRRRQELLKQNIPSNLIDKRKGPGNMMLSYISGATAINLLNEIFGYNGWTSEIKSYSASAPTSNLPSQGGGGGSRGRVSYNVSARVVVRITILKDNTFREGIGIDEKTDSSPAKAEENALKGAETDAFKRAIRQFGPYLGLSLYK